MSGSEDSPPPCSASFTITAKGPGLHRQFKGTATIKSGQASAATLLLGMLHQIIMQDGLTGDTSITAKLSLKPNHDSATGVVYSAPGGAE